MRRMDEVKLKASLTKAIDTWLMEDANSSGLPIVGEDLAEIMATAAMAVIRGIADTEDYLRSEDMLKEE